jgi:hypothetical protein
MSLQAVHDILIPYLAAAAVTLALLGICAVAVVRHGRREKARSTAEDAADT